MVVVPCSMRTLSAIAYSLSDNLLVRAADVALKERRPLVVAPRETPLHLGHLRTMVRLAEMGAILAPPMPAFYHRPESVEDIVDQTVNRLSTCSASSCRRISSSAGAAAGGAREGRRRSVTESGSPSRS